MSNVVTNRCKRLQLTPVQKAVLMCLADYANDAGECWPSIPGIAEWTCLSRTSVIDALKALEQLRVVTITRQSGRNNRCAIDLEVVERLGNPSAGRTRPPGVLVREADPTSTPGVLVPVRQAHQTRPPGVPEPLEDTSETPRNHQEMPPAHPVTKKQRAKAKRQIPDDWQPDTALATWFAERRPDLQMSDVVEVFRNHYIGKGEARADWNASFRTWALRERRSPSGDAQEALEASNRAVAPRFLGSRSPTRRPMHSGFDALDYSDRAGDFQ